jgi:predicted Zn-dependent protease
VQILTRDVLRWLQGYLPEDAFCLLGITMEDLYPNPSWNFVFGEAALRERVGVASRVGAGLSKSAADLVHPLSPKGWIPPTSRAEILT